MIRHVRPRVLLAPALAPLLFSAIASAADAPSPPPEAMTVASALEALHLPRATQTRLDNGLVVVLEEDHASPEVALTLRHATGWRDDPAGKRGLAELTARMMEMETKHAPPGTYDATLDRIGARERGWSTALDATAEWVTVPSNAVDPVLWLWSDQMGFFEPQDPKAFFRAREAQRTRIAGRAEGPATATESLVEDALFPSGHPYHSAAWPTEPFTLDEVRAFHDGRLVPNDAVLVLVGDFDPSAMLERVRAYFATIPAGPPRETAKPAPAQLEEEVRLEIAADVKAPEVWIDWRTPAWFDAGDADLDVAARALVGTRVSTLRWELVDKQQLATRVTARQISHSLGSDFRITVTVASGHTAEETLHAVDTELALLRARPLTDRAFTGARANMTVPFVQGLDRSARRAFVHAELALNHRDPTVIAGDIGRYDAVTPASVSATMARWLNPANRVVTVVTPDATASQARLVRTTRGSK